MALTTTKLSGTITAGVSRLTLAAYTAPNGSRPYVQLQFATGETCRITDATLSPTLGVVRGYAGTLAVAHTTGEGVTYGLASDPAWANYIQPALDQAPITINAQEITITGATGTDAAAVTIDSVGLLNATGTSGAGLNLPVPTVGMQYWVKNNTTGVCKVYSVGSTINGVTGTTAISISATGTLAAGFMCATAGAWQVVPAAT